MAVSGAAADTSQLGPRMAAIAGSFPKSRHSGIDPIAEIYVEMHCRAMKRESRFSIAAVRALLGVVGFALLIGAIHDVWLGEHNLRGTPIIRLAQPISFWLHVGLQGAMGALLLYSLAFWKPSTDQ